MNFTIDENHRLLLDGKPVAFRQTPNVGGEMPVRRFLVQHFTAGASASSAIDWLCDPESKASAHLVIARDGTVTQLAPFNRVTWHAGRSEWTHFGRKFVGLNACSIGIEFDNAGRLHANPGGGWKTSWGKLVPSHEVHLARHKHGGPACGWHRYTDGQLTVGLLVSRALVERYNLDAVLGHEDIAPRRKDDPGPAFPMERFQRLILEARNAATR